MSTDVLQYVAALAVVLGTVVTSVRSGSRAEQAALVESLKDRIGALEGHIADLEQTIHELRLELDSQRNRRKVKT
jgi:phage shock protein A